MVARLIPTKIHAVMDYTVGVLLLVAPWLFGFADESSYATAISILAGAWILVVGSLTNYEGGFLGHVIPMRMHLFADGGLA